MIPTKRGYRLSSGREFYANGQILGITRDGRLTEGYDSEIELEWRDPEGEEWSDTPFTVAERREIADYMVARWLVWAEETPK